MNNNNLFNKNKHVLVKNVLSKDACRIAEIYAVIQEKRYLMYGDPSRKDDWMVPGSFGDYADPLMESILLKIRSVAEVNTGLKLLPTYSYYRVYLPGQELIRHVDRDACEVTASLCLGFNYDDLKYPWPLHAGNGSYTMEAGDMVLYRGTEVEHWRTKFIAPKDSYHVQVFLHYVDADGPHSGLVLDTRKSLIQKEKNGKHNIL